MNLGRRQFLERLGLGTLVATAACSRSSAAPPASDHAATGHAGPDRAGHDRGDHRFDRSR